ncbi:VOC family protein [Labilibacter marinus]|uniref:VOC family protein n=1 Tax=Labilibacter marinus TaxID=1477105 RepID=UPI00094F7AA4|nr:VOC family protein [Labilibacter marinus]
MTTVNIYLTFDGNCEEAFNYYKTVFGGDFEMVSRFKEMPPMDNCPEVSAEDAEKIMHITLPIGGDTVIMGNDTGGEWATNYKAGNNFSISISTDSQEKADDFFAKLSKGSVVMPMDKTFWGSYFGMCVDQFGITWMVGCELEE